MVKNQPVTVAVFEERSLDENEAVLKLNHKGWLEYLESADEDELNRVVEFVFPVDGSKRKMTVADAVMHLTHHSSYHRGQIVSLLKGSVDKLPLVTYVVYASEVV